MVFCSQITEEEEEEDDDELANCVPMMVWTTDGRRIVAAQQNQ